MEEGKERRGTGRMRSEREQKGKDEEAEKVNKGEGE